MSDRITKKNVIGLFEVFCKQMGFKQPDWELYKNGDKESVVGTYQLDYVSVYGGWYIEQIINTGLAVSNPFQSYRKTHREMWDTMHFAIRLKEELDRQEKKNNEP